jgi:hypothetical protein
MNVCVEVLAYLCTTQNIATVACNSRRLGRALRLRYLR